MFRAQGISIVRSQNLVQPINHDFSITLEQWPGIKTLSKKFVTKQIPKRSE
jgi:hypothetical protein